MTTQDKPLVVIAGVTGDLGERVAKALLGRGAQVRAVVRSGAKPAKVAELRKLGVDVHHLDLRDVAGLAGLMAGAACVISTLSGLRDIIVDAQSALLDASVTAGVPRFIPSVFCTDFAQAVPGTNRNIDLRRDFQQRLDAAPIAGTIIFTGAFGVLLTAPVPIMLYPLRRVLYWQNPDQLLDFTAIDDVARATASAALDVSAPKVLNIAGDRVTARQLAGLASELSGDEFKLLRGGDLRRLEKLIGFTRTMFPQKDQAFSAFQGMQYLRDMFAGRAELQPLDNARYPELEWTTARDLIAQRIGNKKR